MTPIRIRILTALELQPMTIRQLSQCLSVSRRNVERWISLYRSIGAMECIHGRPNIWRVVR